MAKETAPNRAYLIRCWQESNMVPHAPRWRFSVEEVLHERKRWGFEDLDALLAFLRTELDSDPNKFTEEEISL